jgi:hypothetical protein
MLFPPRGGLSAFAERVHALAEGVDKAVNESGKSASIAVSLSRDDSLLSDQYNEVKRAMKNSSSVARNITAIDFCADEEGFPPSDKRDFISRVHDDNSADPEKALAVLYHVGESFKNMSVDSSIRWVIEAAEMSVHRLGHAISPGIPVNLLEGLSVRESVRDRVEHLRFCISRFDELSEAGLDLNHKEMAEELRFLDSVPSDKVLQHAYTRSNLRNIEAFQRYALKCIRSAGAVIESCPTSNVRIAGLGKYENHPLPLFIENQIPVVIGSVDPGILNTSLKEEIEIAQQLVDGMGINFVSLLNSFDGFRSERLSGRMLDKID